MLSGLDSKASRKERRQVGRQGGGGKAAKTAETVPLLPTLADAYDALVAAGFTATAGEIKVLSTEVKKPVLRLAHWAYVPRTSIRAHPGTVQVYSGFAGKSSGKPGFTRHEKLFEWS